MGKKILIATGDAGESYETLYALHRFEEAGIEPVLAAPSKRRLHLVLHDFEPGWDTYIERQGYGAEASLTFEDVKVDEYFAIMLIGGRAPEYLRHNETLLEITREFNAQEKWIYSICHGIQILIAAGLADGKKLTCYENIRFEVESNGGTFCPEEAVRDGRVISAQTWQSHPDFYREIFASL